LVELPGSANEIVQFRQRLDPGKAPAGNDEREQLPPRAWVALQVGVLQFVDHLGTRAVASARLLMVKACSAKPGNRKTGTDPAPDQLIEVIRPRRPVRRQSPSVSRD
jgi:hypothetical protein